jgi:HPr kinase/phosphorylase
MAGNCGPRTASEPMTASSAHGSLCVCRRCDKGTSALLTSPRPSIHATAVLVGPRAVLIRGPSGSGKSRLALALLQAAEDGRLAFARIVSDDRTRLEVIGGRVLARAVPELAGLIEVRGVGITQTPYEPAAVVGMVIDLGADTVRLPEPGEETTRIEGILLPRLAVAAGIDPMPLVLARIAQLAPQRPPLWETDPRVQSASR